MSELDQALAALAAGEVIVMPTDTVYGIAADAFQPAAVKHLLSVKGRGRDLPPPVLIGDIAALDAMVLERPSWLQNMLAELWPGALTIVGRQQPSLTWDLGETRGTVAVRLPDHPLARELLQASGPLAVSSANRTGQPAATSVAEAREALSPEVSIFLDGGVSPQGEPSTILDVTGSVPRLLREGPVSLAQIHRFNNTVVGVDQG